MKNINVLLASPSPRNIPIFLESMNTINFIDRLFVKFFYPEQDAYEELRNWFLDHKEYTHLMLCADDTVVAPYHVRLLIEDLNHTDYDVITGYANINLTDKKHLYSISKEEISIYRNRRNPQLLSHDQLYDDYGNLYFGHIIKVKWLGFGLTTIRRNIVEKIQFENDSRWNDGYSSKSGCCVDTAFSHVCNSYNIPMYADVRVKIKHLRERDGALMTGWGANRYERKVILERATN